MLVLMLICSRVLPLLVGPARRASRMRLLQQARQAAVEWVQLAGGGSCITDKKGCYCNFGYMSLRLAADTCVAHASLLEGVAACVVAMAQPLHHLFLAPTVTY
jgi:hypothetical protein